MKIFILSIFSLIVSTAAVASTSDTRIAREQFLGKVPTVICGNGTATDDSENSIANKIKAVTNNKDYNVIGSPTMNGENVCIVVAKSTPN